MKIKINFWSFIFSLICIAFFFISISSRDVLNTITNLIHFHPLNIVLSISLITFIFGLVGLSEAKNWFLLLRSILTIVITLILSVVTAYIIFLSKWIPFT